MSGTTTAPLPGAQPNPASAPSGASQPGVPEKPAGSQDGQKPTNPNDPYNLGWDKSKEHYAPKIKERDDKIAALQAELDSIKTKGMNADQLASELVKAKKAEQDAREQADSLNKFVSGQLDARVQALPEKYRNILAVFDKSNHESYAKAVAQVEALATEVNQAIRPAPQGGALPPVPTGVDVQGIIREINRGNTRPYHDAIKSGVKQAELDAAIAAGDPNRKK